MKLTVVGPVFGSSGYCSHTRQLAKALNKLYEVTLLTQRVNGWEIQCNDDELQMINRATDPNSVKIIIDLPHNWAQYCTNEKNIGFLVWEGDKIPYSWLSCIRDSRISQVWVPSEHVYNAVKNTDPYTWSIYKDKIKIVPHGVDLSLFQPTSRTDNIFTFVCNKGFRGENDRGGIQHALKAFMNEFEKGEARLLIKMNPAYCLPPEQVVAIIEKYRIDAGKSIEKTPEILISLENIPIDKMQHMYHKGDIFLNPTEAEAFSLPCLEAMACGLPVITTNFGGQIDFVNNSNGWLINYKLHEVTHDVLYEGINHATPDIEQMQKLMRDIYTNRDWDSKIVKAIETAKTFTWENSGLKAQEALSLL